MLFSKARRHSWSSVVLCSLTFAGMLSTQVEARPGGTPAGDDGQQANATEVNSDVAANEAVTEEATVNNPRTPEDPTPEKKEGFEFGGIPILSFNSDDGLGFGGVGSLFWHDGKTLPFKYQLRLQLLFTTKGINAHDLRLEALELFDLPLRVVVRANFYSSISQNFCGFGNAVQCSDAEAQAAIDKLDLGPVDGALAKKNYFKHRFFRPNFIARGRWALAKAPYRVELMFGYRAFYYQPGQLFTDDKLFVTTPYAGSKIEELFGPDGEGINGSTSQKGLASVFQAGIMLDTRDNEPAPTSGLWVEASARGSSNFWASAWNYAGVNGIARFYVPLDPAHHLFSRNALSSTPPSVTCRSKR